MKIRPLLLAMLFICNFVDASIQAGTCGSKRKSSAESYDDSVECDLLKVEINKQIDLLLLGVKKQEESLKHIIFHSAEEQQILKQEITRITEKFTAEYYENQKFPKKDKAIDKIIVKSLRSLVIVGGETEKNKIISKAARQCMDVEKMHDHELDKFIENIFKE